MECGRYDPEICESNCPGKTDERGTPKYSHNGIESCGSEAPCGRTCDRVCGKCDGHHESISMCSGRVTAWWHDKKEKKGR